MFCAVLLRDQFITELYHQAFFGQLQDLIFLCHTSSWGPGIQIRLVTCVQTWGVWNTITRGHSMHAKIIYPYQQDLHMFMPTSRDQERSILRLNFQTSDYCCVVKHQYCTGTGRECDDVLQCLPTYLFSATWQPSCLPVTSSQSPWQQRPKQSLNKNLFYQLFLSHSGLRQTNNRMTSVSQMGVLC